MTIFKTVASAAILAVAASTASAANFTFFTDRTAFEAALQGIVVYDFDSGAPASGVTITGDDVNFANGQLEDVIDQGNNPDTNFVFDNAVVAFGGDFDLAGPGGQGTNIAIQTAGGATSVVPVEIPSTTAGTFWGFISDMAFSSVLFSEGSRTANVETYHLDNLTTGASPVPLPAGLPLLLAGLGGMALVRRKRQS